MTQSHLSDVTLLRRHYGILPEGVIPKVEEHMRECSQCQARWEALSTAWRCFDEWDLPPPDEGRLEQALDAVLARPLRRPMAPPPRLRGDDARAAQEQDGAEESPSRQAPHPSDRSAARGRLVAVLAFVALVLLLGGGGGLWLYANSRTVGPVLWVTAPGEVAPGEASSVYVRMTDEGGSPLKGANVWLEVRGDGESIRTSFQETDEEGAASLEVKVPQQGEYTLAVAARSPAGERQLSLPLSVHARPALSLQLFGAPIYGGGDVGAKAHLLRGPKEQPLSDTPVIFELFEPSGTRVARKEEKTDKWGLAVFSHPVAKWARPGIWRLVASVRGVRAEGEFEVHSPGAEPFEVEAKATLQAQEILVEVFARDEYNQPIVGRVSVRDPQGALRAESPLTDGTAKLSLPITGSPVLSLEIEDGEQHRRHLEILPQGSAYLSFLPEGGAFHPKLPLRGMVRATRENGTPADVEVAVKRGEEELARGKTGPDGILLVTLPKDALGEPLTLSGPGGSFAIPAPAVLEGPAVRCDRARASVGETLDCEVFHPDPKGRSLFVTREGQLLEAIFVPGGDGIRRVKVPLRKAGVLSIGFPETEGIIGVVSVDDPSQLTLTLEVEGPPQPEEGLPVSLLVSDASGQKKEALIALHTQEKAPPTLSLASEEEARFALASHPVAPLRFQEISSLSQSKQEISRIRYRVGLFLRWGALLLAAFLLTPAVLYAVWRTRFFLILLPTAGIAASAFFLFSLGPAIALGILLLGAGVGWLWQRSQDAPRQAFLAGGIGVAGLSLVGWWVLPTGGELFGGEPNPPLVPLPNVPSVTHAEEVLGSPILLTTNAEGSASANPPMPRRLGKLLLFAEAFSDDGATGAVVQEVEVSADLQVDISFPEGMTEGDVVSVPVVVTNHHSAPVEALVEFSADAGLETRGPRLSLDVPAGGSARGFLRVAALSPGRALVTVSASTPILLPAFADAEVQIRPRSSPNPLLNTGEIDGEGVVFLPPETQTARLTLFPSALAASSVTLSRLSSPLGCSQSVAAAAAVEALLLARLPESAAVPLHNLYEAQQNLAALEIAEGGFSGCGEERLDLIGTALALLALQSADGLIAIDASMVARAQARLARWLQEEGAWPDPTSALVAWVLAASGGLEAEESRAALEHFVKKLGSEKNPSGLPGYTLAASAAFWVELGRPEEGKAYLEALRKRIEGQEGLFPAEEKASSGAEGRDADIEATALVLLALESALPQARRLRQELLRVEAASPLTLALVARAQAKVQPTSTGAEVEVLVGEALAGRVLLEEEGAWPINLSPYLSPRAKELRLKTRGRVFYRLEVFPKEEKDATAGAPEATAPFSFSVLWPEAARLGERVPVTLELGSETQTGPLQVVLPLPSPLSVDKRSLSALVESGTISRFATHEGNLLLAIPGLSPKEPLRLGFLLQASRLGTAIIPEAWASPAALPTRRAKTPPTRIEVTGGQ